MLAQFRIRIPARIEQYKNRADLVPVRDVEECVDALLESGAVLFPQQVVQEHTHGVHAQTFGPSELTIDALGIERVSLPHLELVDGIGRKVVTADQPRLFGIPGIRRFGGPTLVGVLRA